MREELRRRALREAAHICATGETVRACAAKFGVSKTTVHKDVTERLERIDPDIADRVRAVLEVNKSERHIRGGAATAERKSAARRAKMEAKEGKRIPQRSEPHEFI